MVHVRIMGWDSTNGTIPAGTATIGNVALVAGTATQNTLLVAGAANVGEIYSTGIGGLIRFGGVATTAQYASFAFITSAAAQIVVTSVSAKVIVVLAAALAGSPAMTVQFFSASTTRSGPIPVLASTPITLQNNRDGWLKTNAGESLTVTPSVSGQLGGMITYIVV